MDASRLLGQSQWEVSQASQSAKQTIGQEGPFIADLAKRNLFNRLQMCPHCHQSKRLKSCLGIMIWGSRQALTALVGASLNHQNMFEACAADAGLRDADFAQEPRLFACQAMYVSSSETLLKLDTRAAN